MEGKAKLQESLTFEEWRNPKIEQLMETLPTQRDKDVAALVLTFIKEQFPETEDVLNGALAYRVSWKVDPLTGKNVDVKEEFFEWESQLPESQPESKSS